MITKLNCSVKSFTHIVHVADIHIRLTKRHEEYSDVFDKFYVEVEKTPPSTAIAILGDLFHSKSDLSPECIQSAKDFLFKCASIRPTILIAGNHDATLTNKNRLDSLTPLVGALNHTNLFYMKNNGLYSLGNLLFNNMSVFSETDEYIKYDDISDKHKNEHIHHIATYHGPVNSALTDLGFYLVNKAMPADIFDGHHLVLLGDIHKKQDLQHFDYKTSKPAIHYPGSMIQQNHGESMDGHGFSLWDLKSKTYVHTNIPNDYGFFTVEINKGKLVTDLTNIPKKARVHVKCFESVTSEVKSIVSEIKGSSSIDEISYERIDGELDNKQKANVSINLSDVTDVTYQNTLLSNFLKDKCEIKDEELIKSVLEVNTKLNSNVESDKFVKHVRWKPKRFEFDNMFSYGENNVIDFSKAKDIMGLFAPNACGKSSIFSALSFCIFDKFDRGFKAAHVLNVQKSNFKCKFNFEINGVDFFIERKGTADRKGNVKVEVKFWKVVNGKDVDLNGEARRNANDLIKDFVGSYEDFILTSLSIQNVKNVASFIDMGQSERKDLLAQFIGLTIFDKLLELASNESKDIFASIKAYKKDDFEIKLLSNKNEFSSLTSVYSDIESQIGVLKGERNQVSSEILEKTKQLRPISVDIIDVPTTKLEIERITSQLKTNKELKTSNSSKLLDIERDLKQIDDKILQLETKNVASTFKKYQSTKSELAHIDQALELKKVDVGGKVKKLDMLKKHEYDPNCKYCINSIFVKDAVKISEELSSDKISVAEMIKNRNKIKGDLDNMEWSVTSQEEYTNFLKQKNLLNDTNTKYSNSQKTLENSIKNMELELVRLNKNLVDNDLQQESIKFNKELDIIIRSLGQKNSNLEFNINQKNTKLIESNGRLSVLKNQIEELSESIKKVKILEKQYEVYSLYLKAVNRDGLPYVIISNTVPTVEKEVNNILNQIVEFHLDIETDGKNVTPYIVYDDRRWPIDMASGFEKFISSLAIRVALINISNLPRPNIIIVDEGFGVIDSNNMTSIQTMLSSLKRSFDAVIIISHLDALRDMVDHHIEIKKENGFSKVEFI